MCVCLPCVASSCARTERTGSGFSQGCGLVGAAARSTVPRESRSPAPPRPPPPWWLASKGARMTNTHLRRSYDTPSRRWIELKCNKLDENGPRANFQQRAVCDRLAAGSPPPPANFLLLPLFFSFLFCKCGEISRACQSRWPRGADTARELDVYREGAAMMGNTRITPIPLKQA